MLRLRIYEQDPTFRFERNVFNICVYVDMGFWKAIRKWGHFVTNKTYFDMGNGQRGKFWTDKCCGDTPLSISFPSLFAITSSKEAWVQNVWREGEGEGHWDPIFCRHLNDWEVEGLFLRLGTKTSFLEGMDKLRWEETKSGDFSTKAMYKVLGAGLYSAFPSTNI